MDDGTAREGGHFEAIDSNLTVFALANGLDLAKADGHRRLEWFSEGLERGIVIEPTDGGGYDVRVLTWRSGRPESQNERVVSEGLSVQDLRSSLSDAIETANGLEAPPKAE